MYVWEDASEENAYYTTSTDSRFNSIRFSSVKELSRLSFKFDVSNNNNNNNSGAETGTYNGAHGILTFMYGSTRIRGIAQ